MSNREPTGKTAQGSRFTSNRWRGAVQRIGRPLAVIAIVFQMALLFGHHHFDELRAHKCNHVIAAAFLLPHAGQPASAPDRDQAPAIPAHKPCFLCTAIHAAASLDTGAPQLALPVAYDGVAAPFTTIAFILPPPRAAAFDSRGPPPA